MRLKKSAAAKKRNVNDDLLSLLPRRVPPLEGVQPLRELRGSVVSKSAAPEGNRTEIAPGTVPEAPDARRTETAGADLGSPAF